MEFTPMGYVDVSSGAMQPMMQMSTTPAIYMPSDSAMGFTPMGYVDVSAARCARDVRRFYADSLCGRLHALCGFQSLLTCHIRRRFCKPLPAVETTSLGSLHAECCQCDSLYAYRSCGENPNALRPPKHAETAEEGRRVHSHASSFRGSQTLAEPAIRGDAHHRGGFQVVCAPEPVYRQGKSLELNSVCWHTFS